MKGITKHVKAHEKYEFLLNHIMLLENLQK